MNIHEYQGKSILKSFGVAVQEGIVADSPEGATEAAKKLKEQTGTGWFVVKAQIHAGGRGKGKIEGKEQRGVAVAKSEDDVNFWITNDDNKIPVLVKAKIPVGIVKMHLVEWSGLKNELTSKL